MNIQIVGMGCSQCRQMEADIKAVVAQTGIPADISQIDDPISIVQMGILSLPQLVVNGKLIQFRYRGRQSVANVLAGLANS